MHRRALTAALASASVALGGALAATTVPAQAEDPTTSPLRLSVPDRVVARSSDGWVYSTLGVRMTAQGEPFEIHANRLGSGEATSWYDPAYDSPITATWVREGGNEALPDDAMSTWQGLDDFASVEISRGDKVIREITTPGCFNGNARKVGPEGPVSNPYPWGCPWNVYTLGSVMGVAEDYSTSLLPEYSLNMRLRPGTYTMTASIEPEWREIFGISEADGVVETELVVKERRRGNGGGFRRDAAPRQQGTDDLEPVTEEPTRASQGAPDNEFAPDLRSLPAFDISLNGKGTAMRFGATVWNGGGGPMVIEGFRDDDHTAGRRHDPGHELTMTAYQYYFDGNGNQTGYDQVGELNFHEGNHNHWHFEDFARYRLLNEDMTEAVMSTKASFCLVATDAVDLTVPNADFRPEYTDLGSQCGGRNSKMLREVLANGHGDTYHQFRTGQAFRIGDVPDGIYYISVESNPADDEEAENGGRNLMERDYDNNDSLRKVKLVTNPKTGKRRVKVFKVGAIEEYGFEEFRAAR